MNPKELLIPIAALAVSATGVSAVNGDVRAQAVLTDDQISAFETAQELRSEGDKDAARAIINQAGLDSATLESVRQAMHAHKDALRTAIDAAVEQNDYPAFKEAIVGSPLADIITTQKEFQLFSEAHTLRKQGDSETSQQIMDDLGLKPHHAQGLALNV